MDERDIHMQQFPLAIKHVGISYVVVNVKNTLHIKLGINREKQKKDPSHFTVES